MINNNRKNSSVYSVYVLYIFYIHLFNISYSNDKLRAAKILFMS